MLVKKKNNIVMRKIHDTFFLIDITDNYNDEKCKLYEINDIGAFIWENIDGKTEISVITKKLISAIKDENLNYNEIYMDVEEYIEIMINNKFVEKI